MMLGIWSMILRIFWASSVSLASSSARRSALAFTLALASSASASLEGSFLDWPMRMPTCLDRLFRAERSSWASAMTARFSLSSSSTSSTRGSFSSWNFFLMFSFTRSGFSRISLMSSILEHSLILIIMCWVVRVGEGRFHVKHSFFQGDFAAPAAGFVSLVL